VTGLLVAADVPPQELNVIDREKIARTERTKQLRRNTSPPQPGWNEVEKTIYRGDGGLPFRQKPDNQS
jgi:hypothetical protein